jgi:copper chaperone CopZ
MNTDETADTPTSDSAEALHNFMEEQVTIEGGINPSREKNLGALLQNLQGVQSVSIAGDEVSITYDPTEITSKEMHERMRGAGFTPGERETAPADPPVGH